jgi:hypothetical protein
MKNFECYIIRNGLNDIRQIPYSELSVLGAEKMKYIFHSDFVMVCARNKKAINEHIEILESVKKPSDDHEKYQAAQREIAKKYSQKDDTGESVITTRTFPDGSMAESYVVDGVNDKSSAYSKESAKLNADNKKIIDDQKAKEKQFNASLDNDAIGINLHLISAAKLPMGLSLAAGDALLYFLEEEFPVIVKTPSLKLKKP